MALVDIIVPTVDNPQFLNPMVQSLGSVFYKDLANLIIVNNGQKESVTIRNPQIKVLHAGKNLGWEGGLKLGLSESKSPFVCFLNDDVYFPPSSALWLDLLLRHFKDENCAAAGPSCNNIRGAQNIWASTPVQIFKVTYLIGLCFLLRRDYLDQCGGVDDTLPGGDDIDLSIRLRKSGKHLICDRNAFVYHHLSTTGRRLRSDWDSATHQEAYNKSLWEKHTLKELLYTYNSQIITGSPWENLSSKDPEGDAVRKHIIGEKIYELGCGDTHTAPGIPGIDRVEKGKGMTGVQSRISDADIVANVFDPLPVENVDCFIARHILEHTHDPLGAILNWKKSLKPHTGRLIVAVPDEDKGPSIPMNPEHKSAFTKISLTRLMEAAGLKTISVEDSGTPISFVGVWDRNGD